MIAYFQKDSATYSLNIDRTAPPPTPNDYLRLASALSASLSQIASASPPAN